MPMQRMYTTRTWSVLYIYAEQDDTRHVHGASAASLHSAGAACTAQGSTLYNVGAPCTRMDEL